MNGYVLAGAGALATLLLWGCVAIERYRANRHGCPMEPPSNLTLWLEARLLRHRTRPRPWWWFSPPARVFVLALFVAAVALARGVWP